MPSVFLMPSSLIIGLELFNIVKALTSTTIKYYLILLRL